MSTLRGARQAATLTPGQMARIRGQRAARKSEVAHRARPGQKDEFVRRQDLEAWGQEWEQGAIARMQAGMQSGMAAMLAASFRAEVGPLVKRIE